MEVPVEFTGSNDQSHKLKRKRAKRQRTLSPSTVAVTSSSSTGGGSDNSYFPIPSPASSGNNSTNKEKDEDMAKCLILLARGGRKSDSFVYDCKTCNRTFPSFQALGGHRASHNHRKPKNSTHSLSAAADKPSKPITTPKFISPPFTALHMETQKTLVSHAGTKPSSKVHGCSVCGVVFSSGQALGGHMRRHRATPPPMAAQISDSSDKSTTVELCGESNDMERKYVLVDLNLPAPLEDDFQFVENKTHLVLLSAPALEEYC